MGHPHLLHDAQGVRAGGRARSPGDRLHRAPRFHRLAGQRPGDHRRPARAAPGAPVADRRRGLLRRADRGARAVPRAAHLVRRRDRRTAPVRRERRARTCATPRSTGSSARCTRSTSTGTSSASAGSSTPMPDATMRRYLAEVVEMIEHSDVFQVLAHVDFPRRYWPGGHDRYVEKDYEEEYRAVFRALARHRPGARGEHDQPARLGRPGPLVLRGGRRGGQLRQRRPRADRGRTEVRPRRRTSSRRPASARAATRSTSGAVSIDLSTSPLRNLPLGSCR